MHFASIEVMEQTSLEGSFERTCWFSKPSPTASQTRLEAAAFKGYIAHLRKLQPAPMSS